MAETKDPTEVGYYEGLVFKTASLVMEQRGGNTDDFEDVRQELRVTVWKAIVAYVPAKAKQPIEKFVFTCLTNRVKDIHRKRRLPEISMEDVAPNGSSGFDNHVVTRDEFEAEHLAVEADLIFASVEEEHLRLPSTLDKTERAIVLLLYCGRTQTEAAEELALTRSQMETRVKRIREKLADWRPSAEVIRFPLERRHSVLRPEAIALGG